MPWIVLPKNDPRFFKISKRFQVKTHLRFILMTPGGIVIEENAEKDYFCDDRLEKLCETT